MSADGGTRLMGQNSLEVSPTTGQWHPGRGKMGGENGKRKKKKATRSSAL